MKFRLVEDTVYKIHSDKSETPYVYLIGNDRMTFRNKKDIYRFLNRQYYSNKEVMSPNIVDLLQTLPDDNLVSQAISKMDLLDNEEIFTTDGHLFLNLTNRNARKTSPIIMNGQGEEKFLKHHLDGNEANKRYSNILGLSDKEPTDLLHKVIHAVDFKDITKPASREFSVCTIDEFGTVHNKKLKVTLELIS